MNKRVEVQVYLLLDVLTAKKTVLKVIKRVKFHRRACVVIKGLMIRHLKMSDIFIVVKYKLVQITP